jgi:hypothetical protein
VNTIPTQAKAHTGANQMRSLSLLPNASSTNDGKRGRTRLLRKKNASVSNEQPINPLLLRNESEQSLLSMFKRIEQMGKRMPKSSCSSRCVTPMDCGSILIQKKPSNKWKGRGESGIEIHFLYVPPQEIVTETQLCYDFSFLNGDGTSEKLQNTNQTPEDHHNSASMDEDETISLLSYGSLSFDSCSLPISSHNDDFSTKETSSAIHSAFDDIVERSFPIESILPRRSCPYESLDEDSTSSTEAIFTTIKELLYDWH